MMMYWMLLMDVIDSFHEHLQLHLLAGLRAGAEVQATEILVSPWTGTSSKSDSSYANSGKVAFQVNDYKVRTNYWKLENCDVSGSFVSDKEAWINICWWEYNALFEQRDFQTDWSSFYISCYIILCILMWFQDTIVCVKMFFVIISKVLEDVAKFTFH